MKNNIELVEYCKQQIGKPYWWGTFGQIASESLYNQKKTQYPNQYTASDFKNQYGQKVHDCVGLIKGFLWTNNGKLSYNSAQDKDVSGYLKLCNVQGDISSIPEIAGLLVFMKGHVGVYIGKGEVIEAKGHKYGVCKTKLANRGWNKWGKLSLIEYIEEEEEMRYNTIDEIPNYAKETIQKLMDKGILKGNGSGNLDLSEDMIRLCVILDRTGIFG